MLSTGGTRVPRGLCQVQRSFISWKVIPALGSNRISRVLFPHKPHGLIFSLQAAIQLCIFNCG